MPNKGTMNAKQKRAGSLGQSSRLYNIGNKLVPGGQGFNNLQLNNNSTTYLKRIKKKRVLKNDKIFSKPRFTLHFGGVILDASGKAISLVFDITKAPIFTNSYYKEIKETLEEIKFVIEDIIHGPKLNCPQLSSILDLGVFLDIVDFGKYPKLAGWSSEHHIISHMPNNERYLCPNSTNSFLLEVIYNQNKFKDNLADGVTFNNHQTSPTVLINGKKEFINKENSTKGIVSKYKYNMLFNTLISLIVHDLAFSLNSKLDPLLDSSKEWYIGPPNSRAVKEYQDITKDLRLNRIPIENDFLWQLPRKFLEKGVNDSYNPEHRTYNGIFHPAIEEDVLTSYPSLNASFTRVTAGLLEDLGYEINFDSKFILPNKFVNPQIKAPAP